MNDIPRKSVISPFLYTLFFNTIIAIFLTALGFGNGFAVNLIFSQCIGLSICSGVLAARYLSRSARPAVRAALVATALLAGTIAGALAGSLASGMNPSVLFKEHGLLVQMLLLGALFGSMITYFFSSREQMAASQVRLQEETIRRLTSEKKTAEANFRLLQAQIEPHFLFNTLSNILSLFDTDPQNGKSMLADFIHYLRMSLSKTRSEAITLGQEIEMIRAYLNIFKVRMGDRLRYRIDIPGAMAMLPIPPMLLQPLVENAIKHGLEPEVEGGQIWIRGEQKNDLLRLEVTDSGRGFSARGDSGVGLSNIRQRLESLYGSRARLILKENQPGGLQAIIEVPCDKP